MAWTTPKTNWKGTDTFNASDWLRIVNNVKYLADAWGITYTPFTSVTDGETLLTSKNRNDVTDTIEKICKHISASWDRGYVAPREDYGSTWNSRDLNIIESLLLGIYNQTYGTLPKRVIYYAGSEIICGDSFSVGLL